MKRVFTILLTALVLAALAGCGGSGGDSAQLTSGTTGTTGTAGTTQSGGILGAFTDLGDLAGPTGVNWLYTKTKAINDSGQVVGSSFNDPKAFLWEPSTGLMSYLGMHAGYYDDYYGGSGSKLFIYSEAVDVNSSGWAIGSSNTGAGWPDVTEQRAFVANSAGVFIDLAPVTENPVTFTFDVVKEFSEAVDINDAGEVILNVDDLKDDGTDGGRHAYYWDGGTYATAPSGDAVPYLWNLYHQLGADSEAVAINENGDVVVNSGTTAWWSNVRTGERNSVGRYGSDSSAHATDMNEAGKIVGVSGTLGFFWEAGSMDRIDSLGGDTCEPMDINNADKVVGSATTSAGETHAFLWELINGVGQIKDLGTLGGTNSYATAINDSGIVVGYSETGEYLEDATGSYPIKHAFLWANGVMYDLGVHNDFYSYPFINSYPFSEAVGINASGTVVGNSYSINSNYRGFILSPTFP